MEIVWGDERHPLALSFFDIGLEGIACRQVVEDLSG
jgi:hypothetical protein